MPHFKKGSAAAKAWGAKMQRLRGKKAPRSPGRKRRHSIRHRIRHIVRTSVSVAHHPIRYLRRRRHPIRAKMKKAKIQIGNVIAASILTSLTFAAATGRLAFAAPTTPPPPLSDVVNVSIIPIQTGGTNSPSWTVTALATPTIGADTITSSTITWGDGTTTNGLSGSHTYAYTGAPEQFTITVKATDNTGISGSNSVLASISGTQTTVSPTIVPTMNTITSGAVLTVVGNGFTPNGSTQGYLNGSLAVTVTASTVQTNGLGAFTVNVPYGSFTGTASIYWVDVTTGLKSVTSTVVINAAVNTSTPTITSPTNGSNTRNGNIVSLQGTGVAGDNVSVSVYSSTNAVVFNITGTVFNGIWGNWNWDVNNVAVGTYTIKVTDTTKNLTSSAVTVNVTQ